jgi:hypothetical protein
MSELLHTAFQLRRQLRVTVVRYTAPPPYVPLTSFSSTLPGLALLLLDGRLGSVSSSSIKGGSRRVCTCIRPLIDRGQQLAEVTVGQSAQQHDRLCRTAHPQLVAALG